MTVSEPQSVPQLKTEMAFVHPSRSMLATLSPCKFLECSFRFALWSVFYYSFPAMLSNLLNLILLLLLGIILPLSSGDSCESPSVTSNVYTTTDGLVVTNVAFIAEFSVTCKNAVKNLGLYADINGKAVPAVHSLDGTKYQVSWTEDTAKASSGDHILRVFDEEGFAALRKAQRSGEGTDKVKPLFTITVNHPGTYLGPWVQSEFVAVVATFLLWYAAYSAKSKLQA